MAEQNLPIKLFSKREDKDERRTEGGRNEDLPSWLLEGAELEAKATEFREALTETAEIIANRPQEKEFIPAIVKISFKQEALAKNHRSEVGKIFNRKDEYNFIGLSEDTNLLVKVESKAHLAFINSNLEKPNVFSWGISAIQEMVTFKPEIELPTDIHEAIKIKLVNYQDRRLNEVVERIFEQTLNNLNVKVNKKTRYSADVTVFKLRDVQADALEQIQEFEALYSLTPMPAFTVTQDEVGTGSDIQVKEPVPGEEYPLVGVLDSGIEAIDHIRPWLDPRRVSFYTEEDTDRAHGTFVAGIILYGDELEYRNWVGSGAYRLLDATVFPRPGIYIDEDELVDNIQNAIRNFPDVKIWNLSLGSKIECYNQEFSDFGKALDAAQDLYDVLISKSAGNCDNFTRQKPKRRITNSADSVRALVVASMAHTQGEYDFAQEGYPSPFSRTGFAANNLVKPDISHFGGNGGLRPDGTITHSGVSSFSTTGRVIKKIGTSFSTPRITALLAGLNHRLAEGFDPLLLKALLIHSAKYPSHLDLGPTDRLKEMGYGRPSTIKDIIYNSPNEITLILRDAITKGGYIEILDFPFPEEMQMDGEYYGEVILTLVAGASLDGTQGAEYCQSNIKVSFGTYDHITQRDTTQRTILNPLGKANPINILLPNNYAQRYRRYLNNPFTAERQLRNYTGKFHPVKKFAVNLTEMTPARRRLALATPKKWFLRLDGLFAQAAEVAANMNGEELSQDFTLIITLRDPLNKENDIYSSVTRGLTSNNFQHSDVRLRNEVKINLRNSLGDLE